MLTRKMYGAERRPGHIDAYLEQQERERQENEAECERLREMERLQFVAEHRSFLRSLRRIWW